MEGVNEVERRGQEHTLHYTRDKCEGGFWQQCKVLGREERQGQVGYTRDTSEGECAQGRDGNKWLGVGQGPG